MLHRRLSILVLGAFLAACSEDAAVGPSPTTPPPPPPPPVLQAGTWELTRADGQPLPAYIAHRELDGQLEQVYVDSARIVVNADGTFEQFIWKRTLRNGALFTRDTWYDAGSWRRSGPAYVLASNGGARQSTVRTATSPILNVTESMVGWPQSGLVAGVYSRRTNVPPEDPGQPPVTETRFRATEVAGNPLSAIVVTERDVPTPNAETFTQLDSAWVALRTDGTYERRAFYSSWYTPNYTISMGYIRVGLVRDYDRGTYVRGADGTLTLTSTYYQNRSATGTLVNNRLRLTQDILAGDPVKADVGYVVQTTP